MVNFNLMHSIMVQGFIQDFWYWGGSTSQSSDKTLLFLGGLGAFFPRKFLKFKTSQTAFCTHFDQN